MSEEAKTEHLKERIRATQRSKLFYDALGYVCLIVLVAEVYLWYSQVLSREIFIITSIIFIIGYVFFSIRSSKNNRTIKALLKEPSTMSIKKFSCPNCKKDIPEGNFEFCPFCGQSLKK